jgi:hypothetical protein
MKYPPSPSGEGWGEVRIHLYIQLPHFYISPQTHPRNFHFCTSKKGKQNAQIKNAAYEKI